MRKKVSDRVELEFDIINRAFVLVDGKEIGTIRYDKWWEDKHSINFSTCCNRLIVSIYKNSKQNGEKAETNE